MTGEHLLLEPGGHVLVVDDQPENLELVEELLSSAGYSLTLAGDGETALLRVAESEPDVIVLDVMMPRLDGFEVCRRLKADPRWRHVPVVMLTALSDVSSKVRGLEVGADDFLNKPVQRDELLTRVRALVRIQRLRRELDSAAEIILTLVRALEQGDPREAGHAERVAASAVATAVALGLPPQEVEAAARGAMLHDIGRLGIPDEVLRLPHQEREGHAVWQRHSKIGAEALRPLRSLRPALEVVRHHHERLDGSGYPDGLSGEAFRPAIEVVGLANLYDDLLRDQGLSPEDAAGAPARRGPARGRFRTATVEAFLGVGLGTLAEGTRRSFDPLSDLSATPATHRTGRILICDDSAANRELMTEMLTQAGHTVFEVSDGESVLPALVEHDPDLVVLDIRLPGVDGFTVCDWIKGNTETRLLPVLMVTAQSDARYRVRQAQVEADDILPSPVNRLEFLSRVRSLLRLKAYHRDLEGRQGVLVSLAALLEARDPYHQGHSVRVSDIARQMGRELGLGEEACEGLRVAGLLHDIGALAVPQRLFVQKEPLSVADRAAIRGHARTGAELVRSLKTVQGVLPLIRHHHERWDGSGYPEGLRGEDIPLGARMLGLADAFDALTSDRAYRPGALATLEDELRRGLWDPRAFAALEVCCSLVTLVRGPRGEAAAWAAGRWPRPGDPRALGAALAEGRCASARPGSLVPFRGPRCVGGRRWQRCRRDAQDAPVRGRALAGESVAARIILDQRSRTRDRVL